MIEAYVVTPRFSRTGTFRSPRLRTASAQEDTQQRCQFLQDAGNGCWIGAAQGGAGDHGDRANDREDYERSSNDQRRGHGPSPGSDVGKMPARAGGRPKGRFAPARQRHRDFVSAHGEEDPRSPLRI
ncbi:hypothetical protein GCM10009544_28520 [Streptomyces stramineus]|uniref:Uncharacterized protein n=1 Tax=Streptomyces stramineus TaxID=173861 RepID=A0ABN1A0A7_9ACTN